MIEIKGIIPLIIPIDENKKVNKSALRRLLDYVIDSGGHGVFVLGSTGEFYGLDFDEKKMVVEITVNHVKGRAPVYVGASTITTKECIKLTKITKKTDVYAVSV
ncbi:hypothetical protein F3K46_02040 [Thermoanaerobacterium thermosaccharolyticum]|nr:hypothetical protein [Thermoanaerobacterium thermosaccharolyticum]MBE0227425.1 hypothetical protein [Thermoanaerobacterium thermosaccharolyticum]